MKKIALLSTLIFITAHLTACSVVQATSGPSSKDLSVLDTGTERSFVLAELEQPIASETNKDGNKVDIFKVIQGQHGIAKAGKGVLYGVLAVGTLGLSEIITSPLEGAVGNGAEMQIKVTYDNNNTVSVVEILKDERWLAVQKVNDKKIENN